MTDVIRYDAQASARIQAFSETPEMRAQRSFVLELLAPQPGESILDIGCGSAQLTREIAAAVGPRGRACGVDISEQMLALAAHPSLELARAEGTSLPLPSASFDAAVATQVYEFVEELDGALAELHRVLRGGGRALILDTDWDTLVWHSSDGARTQRVLDGWRRRLAEARLPRTLAARLGDAGFNVLRREAYVIFDPVGGEHSYSSHQIAHLGASALGVDPEEVTAWAEDLRDLARRGEYFFSLNRYVFLAAKPGRG